MVIKQIGWVDERGGCCIAVRNQLHVGVLGLDRRVEPQVVACQKRTEAHWIGEFHISTLNTLIPLGP